MAFAMILRGAYTAERASALAGVPKSTLHYWARHEILMPSISPEKVRLWSWADLIGARAIYWMRHPSDTEPRTQSAMAEVKRLFRYILAETAQVGDLLMQPDVQLFVDRNGRVFLARNSEDMRRPLGAGVALAIDRSMTINALTEFRVHGATLGPDLRVPRPHLRIVPGKLGGEPHIAGTRIETSVVAALNKRRLSDETIVAMYPDLTADEIAEALDLEGQLEHNALAA